MAAEQALALHLLLIIRSYFFLEFIMKSFFTLINTSLKFGGSHKIILALAIGFTPFMSNCSKAKYGETTKQAPVPAPAVAPKVLPADVKAVPQPAKAVGTMKDIDGTPVKDTTPELSNPNRKPKANPFVEYTKPNEQQPVIVIGNRPVVNPCPQQCAGPQITAPPQVRVAPVQVVPVQNVPCVGGSCHKSPFVQNFTFPTQNVDILFVVDSNVSLNDQRFAVFQNIESLLNNLPTNINYRLAVLNTQDAQSSLYATPSQKEQVVKADLALLNSDDRAKALESAKQDIWDRISTLNTANFIGTSESIMKKLDSAITSPELEKNQANGFFRNDAGLVMVSLTDERVTNQVLHPVCIDLAKKIYEKIVRMKTIGVKFHVLQVLPIEMIGFAYLDSDERMNHARNVPFNSDMLELLHLGDGVLFDLAKANANPEQMKANLRYAGDQIYHMWMKRRFQIRSDVPMDPKSVCFVANGQLLPTNFVPELNEMRVDPKVMRSIEQNVANGMSTDVFWCENGETNNTSRLNEYRINPSCVELVPKFQQ